ncbi:MAG: hypothetical protein M3021_06380 [Actinomycetota bacterium]|nr:hypothetical protein [Actinomycetota bacterium]
MALSALLSSRLMLPPREDGVELNEQLVPAVTGHIAELWCEGALLHGDAGLPAVIVELKAQDLVVEESFASSHSDMARLHPDGRSRMARLVGSAKAEKTFVS